MHLFSFEIQKYEPQNVAVLSCWKLMSLWGEKISFCLNRKKAPVFVYQQHNIRAQQLGTVCVP